MTEIERIADQLKRAFEGPAWHGPSVREALEGVTAPHAAARPIPRAHTIWELVEHLATWEDVVRRRIGGARVDGSTVADWAEVSDTGEPAWQATRARLDAGHDALARALSALDDAALDASPDGESSSTYLLLHGAIQHDLYHAGQIVLLRRALE